jgi:hypothetical protein
VQWRRNGDANQRRHFEDAGNGQVRLIVQHHRAGLHRDRQRFQGEPSDRSTMPTATTTIAGYRLVNAASGLVLGVQDVSTVESPSAAVGRHRHAGPQLGLVADGSAVRLRNGNSGRLLGVKNAATANGSRVLQWADNGTNDHHWRFI